MVSVQLKGIHSVRVKLANGVRVYHYAWRGGPRLSGAPGSPEFIAAYRDAHAQRKTPSGDNLSGLIKAFRAHREYTSLSVHTKRAYAKHLSAIDAKWGRAPLNVLDDPAIRKAFIAWRDEMADTPRTADMAIGVLKRLLGWAKERVIIHENQAEPISRLHRADRSDAIWTAGDLEALRREASKELMWAVELALHTGLRQSDLIGLTWNRENDGAFDVLTSKRRREVSIPITASCRALLQRIDKRGPVILTTQRGKRPWTADGLRASFGEACKRAGVKRTFHDLRRTAATALVASGLSSGQVASIMGWSEDDVEAMKRKYVSRKAVLQAVLAKLEKGR